MATQEVINENLVDMNLNATSKEEAILTMSEMLYKNGIVDDLDGFMKSVLKRESISSTYSTSELAIPHGISSHVKKAGLCFCRNRCPIDWDGDYETPVRFIFLIAVPKSPDEAVIDEHLKIISSIAISALERDTLKKWECAKSAEEFLATLRLGEEL